MRSFGEKLREILIYLFKIFMFFISFFFINRVIYLFYNYGKIEQESISEILLSNIHALPLDISATSYFLLIIALLFFISAVVQKSPFVKFINGLVIFLIAFCSLINVIDIGLVAAWGTRINSKAMSYLAYPNTMFDAVGGISIFPLVVIFLLQTFIAISLFRKYFMLKHPLKVSWAQSIAFVPLLVIIFIGVRGGFAANPIGKSSAAYSENATLNFSAINGFWNFSKILMNESNQKLIYDFFPIEEAENIVRTTFEPKESNTQSILKTNRPNIVVILLESFNANNMFSFGGKEKTTPFLDELTKESINFPNFYATGRRTEQGFVAFLSGFPAQPKFSVQREAGKIFQLPIISKEFRKQDYSIDFYYGGDLSYARTDEYLKLGGFQDLYSRYDFPNPEENERGAYDEYMFDAMIENYNKKKDPFFSMALTSSTHGPFFYREQKYKGETNLQEYRNTLKYSDDCLKTFFEKAKKTDWYKNTLFLIMADHTHGAIGDYQYNEPSRYRIPLILTGEVIKDELKGYWYKEPASHIDLPATLLAQMGLDYSKFEFSRDLFDSTSTKFAYYTFDNGFGYLDRNDTIIYNDDSKTINKAFSTRTINQKKYDVGKSFLQVIMQRFSDME